MSMNYSISYDDIIAAAKAAQGVSNEHQMEAIVTFLSNLLGISEDAVNEILNPTENNIEYITFDVVRRLWNDYPIGFEHEDGSDSMCQDNGWSLKDAEAVIGSGRFFVEKPLTGRWSRTANPVGDGMMYSVYRLRDITKIDGGGNRELVTKYWCDKEMMNRLAEELNIRGIKDLEDAKQFAEEFIEHYGDFEPWEVVKDIPVPFSGYTLVRCINCDDEQILMSCDNKELLQQIADELNSTQTADRETAKNIANSIIGAEKAKKGESFVDDPEKMVDFFRLCKYDFLDSYSYLTEEDYDKTCYEVLERSGYPNVAGIDPSDMRGQNIAEIVDGMMRQQWLMSRSYLLLKGGEQDA